MSPSATQFVVKAINSQHAQPVSLEELSNPDIGALRTSEYHYALNVPDTAMGNEPIADSVDDQAIDSAYNDGFAEGFAAGIQEQRDNQMVELNNQTSAKLAMLESLASRLETELHTNADQFANALANRVFDLAGLILGREISGATDPGADALKRCLTVAPLSGDLVAHLNPHDMELLAPDIIETLSLGSQELSLVADDRIESGDAMVLSNDQIIDGRISKAFDQVRELLQ